MSYFTIQNFIFLPNHIFDSLFLSGIGLLGKPLKKKRINNGTSRVMRKSIKTLIIITLLQKSNNSIIIKYYYKT